MGLKATMMIQTVEHTINAMIEKIHTFTTVLCGQSNDLNQVFQRTMSFIDVDRCETEDMVLWH